MYTFLTGEKIMGLACISFFATLIFRSEFISFFFATAKTHFGFIWLSSLTTFRRFVNNSSDEDFYKIEILYNISYVCLIIYFNTSYCVVFISFLHSYCRIHFLSFYLYIYIYIYICIPTSPHEQDVTQGQFLKRSSTGCNTEFSIP